MSNKGVKRASPGADVEKNPLGDVELSDEDAVKLQGIQKDIARVELALGTFDFLPPPFISQPSAAPRPFLPSMRPCVQFLMTRKNGSADRGRVASLLFLLSLQSAARRRRWCRCTRSGARC